MPAITNRWCSLPGFRDDIVQAIESVYSRYKSNLLVSTFVHLSIVVAQAFNEHFVKIQASLAVSHILTSAVGIRLDFTKELQNPTTALTN
jgi:hypothetical protein